MTAPARMTVTLAQLRKLDACQDYLDTFERLFGEEVEVTRELCIKHAADFNWNWAAENLLSAPARAAYQAARASAETAYQAAMAPAWAAYQAARASAWFDAFSGDRR